MFVGCLMDMRIFMLVIQYPNRRIGITNGFCQLGRREYQESELFLKIPSLRQQKRFFKALMRRSGKPRQGKRVARPPRSGNDVRIPSLIIVQNQNQMMMQKWTHRLYMMRLK